MADRFKIIIESDPLVKSDEGTSVTNLHMKIRGSAAWAAMVIDRFLMTNPQIGEAFNMLQVNKFLGIAKSEDTGVTQIDNTPPTDGDTIN